MFSLATIMRMNAVKERRKLQARARRMNAKNKAHPKNAEKTGDANYASPAQDNLL